jgi:hypothetical protein
VQRTFTADYIRKQYNQQASAGRRGDLPSWLTFKASSNNSLEDELNSPKAMTIGMFPERSQSRRRAPCGFLRLAKQVGAHPVGGPERKDRGEGETE